MPRHALINPTNQIDRFAENVDPNVQTKPGWKWLRADPATPPSFDPETQMREGPTYVIDASAVTESYSLRALTAQELSERKDGQVSAVTKVLAAALFDAVNDIRALKVPAQAALTKAQFTAYLKTKVGNF